MSICAPDARPPRLAEGATHAPATRLAIASFPPLNRMNPYQRLLYEHLRDEGIDLVEDSAFRLTWLRRARGSVAFLHFHWPEPLYTYGKGPVRLRRPLSWLKLGLFWLRLASARALGYRLVWSIHQVYPHEDGGRRRDRIASGFLARACDVLIAHDEWTAELARRELGGRARGVRVVPHGSYVGVYPSGRAREEVRGALGIPLDAFAFVSFGELRANKSPEDVVTAFRLASLPAAALVIAGFPKKWELAEDVLRCAAGDPRIVTLLRYIRDEEVAELFGACDAAVLAREDGGTSGSLVLPLSLGLPVVAADRPAYADLLGREDAGWLFTAGDVGSLAQALERAASDSAGARQKGAAGLRRAERLGWPAIAHETATALRASLGARL